jgi:membrane associated rhomboid family serine protease
MILPIGDTPNPRGFTAYVNWALIIANVAVYLLVTLPLSDQGVDASDPFLLEYLKAVADRLPEGVSAAEIVARLSAYDLFVFAHGYKPGAPELRDLFGSMFLHGGAMHLAGNMLFLWIFGDNVEHRLGRVLYLIVYLTTGAAATLAFSLFAAGSMVPLVGASGAISGVLGLYFLMFPRNKVKTFVFFFPFIFNVFLVPVRWVLGFYVIVDNLLPFIVGADSGVAYGAHLGGFVAGAGIAWVGERRWWGATSTARPAAVNTGAHDRRNASSAAGFSVLDALRGAIARSDAAAAQGWAARMPGAEFRHLNPREFLTLAKWMRTDGHHGAAALVLRRCLAANPGAGDLSRVYLELGLIRLSQSQPTAAYQHLLSVFDHNPSREVADRAREALDRINIYRKT